MMKRVLAVIAICAATLPAHAEDTDAAQPQPEVEALQQRIDTLERTLEERLAALADAMDESPRGSKLDRVHLGGYGEMHYNNLDQDGTDFRELDFHRLVFFVGYDFHPRARLITELEIEHIVASGGSRGAFEVEQAYIEIDLRPDLRLRTGAILVPVGIINETHEPPTFYGVERPVVETAIIPTTWWVGGASLVQTFANGWSYDLMVSEGLKTEDPATSPSADPFDLRGGKQKASFADAFDLAVTGRVAYSGMAGLQLSAWAQYQPDLDQSAAQSYAEDATLIGGHARYQSGALTGTLLLARWDLAGPQARTAGRDVQQGGYLELAYKPWRELGLFVRHSSWSVERDVDASQTDVGANYYPFDNIVFKVDVQLQNQDAGNADGFNLGLGYQF